MRIGRSLAVLGVFGGLPLALAAGVTPLALRASQRVSGPPAVNMITDAERQAGWVLLFDGKTIDRWHGYGSRDVPPGWQVVDGTLTRVQAAVDLASAEDYADFELMLDWRIAPAGNSGIMFRVVEGADPPYYSGPEMQILDNARHADGRAPETSAGSNYALHAPTKDMTRPVGEWNAVRLLARGNHVEHWLNGEKIVEYELGSPDWVARVKKSKFNEWPPYGRARAGRIVLQDHGDVVSFRNIKIRRLGSGLASCFLETPVVNGLDWKLQFPKSKKQDLTPTP
jgi:hypothetical protein